MQRALSVLLGLLKPCFFGSCIQALSINITKQFFHFQAKINTQREREREREREAKVKKERKRKKCNYTFEL